MKATIHFINTKVKTLIFAFFVVSSFSVFAQKIDVTGNGNAIYDGSTTTAITNNTNFGSVNAGSTKTLVFTINNTSNKTLNISSIAFSGAGAANFSVGSFPASIAQYSSGTFSITFSAPAIEGTYNATVTIRNNSTGQTDPYTFAISGISTSPKPEIDIVDELDVAINSGSTNSPSVANNTAFGTTATGSTISKIYTIYNSGTQALNITSITTSNTVFAVSPAGATTIAPGASINLTVSFTPTLSGSTSAVITVNNNDANEGTYTFTVSGEGTAAPPKYSAYYENFDATNGGWTVVTSTADTWLWTNTYPASATSEIAEGGFWRSSNFNPYLDNTTIVVESPSIDFTTLKNLRLSLDVKYKTQSGTDGMRILYSINGGAYTLLGASGSGIQWYEGTVTALSSQGWSGDNHTPAPAFSPYSQFTRSTINLSDAIFAGKTNVKFRIQFSSNTSTTDEGVAFDNFLIEADPLVPLSNVAVAPANIKNNLRIWLKANAGIAAADGAKLTNWDDQAFNTTLDKENAIAAAALAPTYRNSEARNLNFNPVVDFNNANTEYMQGKGGFYSQDYFVVVKSEDIVSKATGTSERQFPIGGRFSEKAFHEDPTGLAFGNSTGRYVDEVIAHNINSYPPSASTAAGDNQYGRAYTSSTAIFNTPLIINVKANSVNTSEEIYKNGKKIDNTTGTTGTLGTGNVLKYAEFKNLPFLLGTGRSGLAGRESSQLNGRLTEVISYSSANSAINQQKIQSYLGIKYGITLQASGSSLTDFRLNDVNYIDSADNIIWNTTTNTGFNYDIAGIGRDDNSILNQKQSKTVNTADDITIGLATIEATNSGNTATFGGDRQFLVWGNNQGSLLAQPAVIVDMSADITPAITPDGTKVDFISIGRTWKVVETGGNVGACKVSIPKVVLSATITPPGDYLMFISSNSTFGPTAEYRIMTEKTVNGVVVLESELYDFDGEKYVTFGYAPERTFVRSIFFDGVNDYLDAGNAPNLNIGTAFTISAWLKRNGTNQTIVSKRNNAFTSGYDFGINGSGNLTMRWNNGTMQTITSSVAIPAGIWHHVAIIYNDALATAKATLYIDGVEDTTANLTVPLTNTQSFLIAAADGVNTTSFFNGNIDEVRVWNVALTPGQLRFVMNQEILKNGLNTNGNIIPNTITNNEISAIPWANLSAYYPMSTYTYTNAKDVSNNNYTAALRNLKTVDRQTAPLPYVTENSGGWNTPTTWLNNTVQDLPNSASIVNAALKVDWNIVRVADNHLITSSSRNINLLGLHITSTTIDAVDTKLTMTGDTSIGTGNGLTITHYLGLDGKIDLDGESQLIQTDKSDLVVGTNGVLERDQQGEGNLYRYNDWSSPVYTAIDSDGLGQDGAYTNVSSVLKDGTTPSNPGPIVFSNTGYDGKTSPLTLSTYWMYIYRNDLADNYSKWKQVRSTGAIYAGEGFLMKGTGAPGSADQNYVFVGKPNNGDINLTISAENDYLIGNPYPSAIDADKFINDNRPLIEGGTGSLGNGGTIYFWEHYGGVSHILREYQAGYATYSMGGAVQAASAHSATNTAATNTTPKIPTRYIPVGQGFFVHGSDSGGTIAFKNSQRIFVTEASGNSIFMKGTANKSNSNASSGTTDTRQKIRIGFDAQKIDHRQLLFTIDDRATEMLDWGFDAEIYEEFEDDMYWVIQDKKYVIQATNTVENNNEIPLGVKVKETGTVKIKIDALENEDVNMQLFLKDSLLQKTYNLKDGSFEQELEAGEYNDRFYLVFKPILQVIQEDPDDVIEVILGGHIFMNNEISELQIQKDAETKISEIKLVNYIGQTIKTWNKNLEGLNISLPVKLATGVYIVQIKTQKGTINKKIIVN